MIEFIESYNKQADKPISTNAIEELSEVVNQTQTARIATEINACLNKLTGNTTNTPVPAKFSNRNAAHVVEILAVSETLQMSKTTSLKLICAVRDLKAIDEPKFFVLTQYDLSIAKRADIISGLILSLVEGPLSHLDYNKFKLSILRDFIIMLNTVIASPTKGE